MKRLILILFIINTFSTSIEIETDDEWRSRVSDEL